MPLADSKTHTENRLPEPAEAVAAVERAREGGRDRRGFVPLDRNERLMPLPDWFIDDLRGSIDSALLTEYPVQEELRDELGESLGVAAENLILTAGSDAAFKALCQAYVRPGDGIVSLDPSYAMYPVYARMFDAQHDTVSFAPDLSLDVDELVSAVRPGVKLVVIANPNQPTGTVLDDDTVGALLDRVAEVGALLVVDEAYYPFSQATILPRLLEAPNLVVTRTFSKASGMAGLRLGFAAAHPSVTENLFKVRSVYDVNSVAILCARKLLARPEVATEYVEQVDAGREVLERRLPEHGFEPLNSRTNFMVVRVGHRVPPAELIAGLRERGYLVRGPFTAPCLADCIRITVGPPALMDAFADVVRETVSGLPSYISTP